MGRLVVVGFALLASGSAEAAAVRVRVLDSAAEPVSGATVELRAVGSARFAAGGRTAATGLVLLVGIPPGAYRLAVQGPGPLEASAELNLSAAETVEVTANPPSEGGEARVRVVARAPDAYGDVFDRRALRELPSSRTVWSLLDAGEAAATTDAIDGPGLHVGEALLAGVHGSSWTQTGFRLGEIDVTDPDRTGTPLWLPDVAALEAVEIDSALAPAEVGSPGASLALVPRRPRADWHGAAEGAVAPSGLQSKGFAPGPSPVARLGSWSDASATADGPLIRERLGLLLAGRFTAGQRIEARAPTELRGRVASGLAHMVLETSDRDEARLLAVFQDVTRPYSGRARLASRDARQTDRFTHVQSTWERRAAGGTSWSISGAFQRGEFDPDLGAETAGAVDRLLDGPVPELYAGASTRQRWDAAVALAPDLSGVAGGRHRPRLGGTFTSATAVTRATGPSGLLAESVGGVAARAWDLSAASSESRWRSTEVAAWAADRIALTSRFDLEAGLRFESTRAEAQGGGRIDWDTLAPRVQMRWQGTEDLLLFGGWGRYYHRLPLGALAFGDPAGPQGAVYRWDDANRDGLLQPGEAGPLVARVGPGGPTGAIDPGLRRPRTDEVVLGLELRLEEGWRLRFAGFHRRERDLLESVNVGVPLSAYSVSYVPDPGADLLRPADDLLLPIYDRDPASFGRDRYLLTNPVDHTTLFQGLELTIERPLGDRFFFRLGATATRGDGYGANRGFRASENDQGLIGEQFDTPNATTFGRGWLFFDRSYTVKIAGTWRAPGDLRLGALVRYQDGQPFSRVVVAPALRQGAEAIQTFPNGLSRFGYNMTVDVRAEKGFERGRARVAFSVEAFNLLDVRREIEEDVRTGGSFRETTAVQPPRAVHLGVRIEF